MYHRLSRSLGLLIFLIAAHVQDTSAKHHHIKLRHGRHRRQHGGSYLPGSFVPDTDEPERGNWGPWSTPSSCSRSCGGGVAHQTRQCLDIDDSGHDRCTGASRRFFSCNIQDCPGEATDFRAEQCAEFNNVPFEGTYYDWIPYTGSPNKCELNCMPRGERFFYRHKVAVIDGTPCESEKNDVCVKGKCMHVGCDMMLGSDAKEDACRECGGDGSDCNTVTGLFDTDDLQVGYIDILLIPEGATNIVIREIQPSNNYLAIRNTTGHYYLNGNWRIDFPRSLRFSGTIFHYARDPQGFAAPDTITALGPTNEPIYVVLLYQDRNVGVHYEYSIPKKFSTRTDPDSYTWVTDQFSSCSVSCGGGYQSRRVACVRRRDSQTVDESLCDPGLEPSDTQGCSEEPCPPMWVEGPWSPCTKHCGEGGEQTREIKCEQVISGGIASVVDDSQCLEKVGPKGSITQECNRDVDCPQWHEGPWKPCDHICGPGKQTRIVTCYRKIDGKIQVLEDEACETEAPEREKACDLRPCAGVDWVTSEWSGCEKICDLTKETRTAHCATQDGMVYSDDLCDADKKPELERECEKAKNCDFQWFTSLWSKCSAECGAGVQTRKVFCGIFSEDEVKKVLDENCDPEEKFEDTKNCTAKKPCKGEWFAGPWSKCSKPCGGGDMIRKVICMRDNKTAPISQCDADSIMFSTEKCNDQPCEEGVTPADIDEKITDSDEEECEEEEEEEKEEDAVEFSLPVGEAKMGKLIEQTELTSLSSPFTGSDIYDMMFSDSTRGDISPSELGSGEGSGDGDFTMYETKFFTDSTSFDTDSTIEKSESPVNETTIEAGTGTTEFGTEVTESSDITEGTDVTFEGSGTTIEEGSGTSPEEGSGASASTSAVTEETVEETQASTSAVTSESDISSETAESTASESSEGSTTIESSDMTTGSSDITTESIGSSDITTESTGSSDITTDLTTGSAETTISSITESTESTETKITDTTDTATTDSTETQTTDSTEPTDTTESTESPPTTSSSETTVTEKTETETTVTEKTETTGSDETTESSITSEITTETSTMVSELTTELKVQGEYDFDSEEQGTDAVTTESSTTEGTYFTTTTSNTEESTVSGTTSSDETATTGSETTETTESEQTTESGETTEASVSTTELTGTTELSETTESGATTESSEVTISTLSATTESGATTESEITETTESGATTESGETTLSGETTESSATTLSTLEETTVSGETTATEVTSSTISGETDLTEKTHVTEIWTTGFPETTAHKRQCKPRKSCKKTPFGCCYDGFTIASGPFGQGCPTPQTCNDTRFGCCPDGVSPATGPKNAGCPDSHCNESLFGCCPDGVTMAQGNDYEGCKKPCAETEFGCCPDNETAADGKDYLGCCNSTEFGCCPDNIKAASGPEDEGCEEETTSETPQTEMYETTTQPISREDCANSTYGCCPDGITIANGTNFAGCGVINTENCSASYFGCCPDGVSAALGPDNYGCRMPCHDSAYGCCEDGVTSAHGPNNEGCCLSTPYKCCPDNILPARGPNFYGCGCQYTRFGCCPDNSTAARGPSNEGCGCQYTPHGCCPNRFTPASGPNFEGCPCYTYQFGCCSDGITIAKGSHGQGCGCENTKYKCCSDGQTPATGPNFAGCTCDASQYGCCPDGIEEAQGENFEGCLTIPSMPGAACGLKKDRGSCRDFTVKWFYDTDYGGCSRFWYGGCEGNENRFKTQEECKEVCVQPKGKAACVLPKIAGPCEGYHPTWYYDAGRKQCGQFIYGGCLGNANKFKTREECEELCVTPDDVDACDQPKETGPCAGNFTRWYYNQESQTCEQFIYGGCKANNNNFPTEIACHQQCLTPGRRKDLCTLPRAEGTCTEKQSRWYFDQSENRCMPFYYTGCGGNKNNFESRDVCETDCPPKIEQDICLLPALLGECHNYTQRWYYDSYEQHCRQFYYGGCGGNENNFVSEQDCVNRCETAVTTPTPPEQIEFRTEFCFLHDEHGPCSENQVKWFYDSRDGVCKQFRYGGCQSNGNNFNTREECEYRCTELQDPCTLPKVVGPCNGFVKQFYYDQRGDSCDEFEYSGCQGNKNRFQDRESCERQCRRQPPVTSPEVIQVTTVSPFEEPKSPICLTPVDSGDCDDSVTGVHETITAYYYDAQHQMCQAFIYSGCGGNANKFQTEEQCERLCGKFHGQDMCNLLMDSGPCRGAFRKYYYEPGLRTCREFNYGGCDGNANRFSTISECESICIHHEEPVPPGNDTSVSNLSICKEPVDSGSCTSGSAKRFYFDEERQTCLAFIYTGCGGNRNRFKTFESCINSCLRTSNEIDVESKDTKDSCAEAKEECNIVRCPYGKEQYVDSQDCERCRCVDPCRTKVCPEGTRCAITLVATQDGTEYKGVCQSIIKPGRCPIVSNSTRCEQECVTDADCPGEWKCCDSGCGTSCLEPAPEEPLTTTSPTVTPPQYGGEPAMIQQPDEPHVSAQEGGYITLKCVALGTPRPIITWRKDTTLIGPSETRRRILLDGSLQIINLYTYDRGTYVCTADNGLGPPVRAEYQLEITAPSNLAAAIIGEPDTRITVTMNSPIALHCYAMGWPRPHVTWWRGERMLPLSSETYEQDTDYTLLIRSVTLTSLGVYTCQAFNAVGPAASWSTILQAIGPVYNVKPEHEEYVKYLVQPPKRPTTEKPQYPYRPTRTQSPEYQTYAPVYPSKPPRIPAVIPLETTTVEPGGAKFKVPVKVNASAGQSQFPEGSDISIACAVDGYPIPRVLWYKNDELIQTNNRIKISELNRLIISDANQEDSGRYRCEATNEYSSDSDSVDIRVAGIFIHPHCQDNTFFANCELIVEAKFCTHKYYAKFCCRSCTEAGQLPARGPHIDNSKRRRRRSVLRTLV
ncbi:papilin isoform X4 [Camponotus floridanus]|uniref:papilin isoform X4 n=1 Tax=Camponotus floridanus TaxID=104421 RepID=UPI000DC68B86|nr:papilin isoform X4 [Camponotus floridanus]